MAPRSALVCCCLIQGVLGAAAAYAQEAPAATAPGAGTPAEGAASPGVTFDYRTSSRHAPPRALVDIAIRSQSPDTETVLWVAPPGSATTPGESAFSERLMRWNVGPLDRFSKATRRVFLMLRQSQACQSGATLWAEVSLNGRWLPAEERGRRTLGGVVADCAEPMLVIEILEVEPQDQEQ